MSAFRLFDFFFAFFGGLPFFHVEWRTLSVGSKDWLGPPANPDYWKWFRRHVAKICFSKLILLKQFQRQISFLFL